MMKGRQRGTLRFRLALGYGLLGAVLLGGFSATLYLYVRERMAQPLDHQLRRDLEEVEKNLEVLAHRALRWKGNELSERSPWITDYPWFELWDEEGRLVRRLWPFAENRVLHVPTAPAAGRETISVFRVAPDLRLRVLSVPFSPSAESPSWMLRLMRVHEPSADALGALRWIIILALPACTLLLAIAGYSVARKWLMPLDRMAQTANQISAENLGLRLPIENPDDEAGQLGTQFNVTLDRLEASFNALDRFVADASHELRTPLTTLRSVGEVGLHRSRSVEEYREIIGSMLEEAARLETLVGRLLELATAEGGAATPHRVEFEAERFLQECVGDLSILAEARGQQIVVLSRPCRLRSDPLLLRQALQNLIDNAIKFSPDDSTIEVSLLPAEKHVQFSVRDEGVGLSREAETHLAERFYRADTGRSRSGGGFGLGLSITKAYLRLLGGNLAYERRSPNGSTFRITIPCE